MAIPDLIGNINIPFRDFLGGDIFKTGLAALGMGFGIIVVIEIISRNRSAEFGTWGSRSEDRREGLWWQGSSIRKIIKERKRARELEKQLQALLKSQENRNTDASSQAAVMAAEEGSKAAEHEARAEEYSAAIEARGINILGGSKGIARALQVLVGFRGKYNNAENQMAASIAKIAYELRRYVNWSDVDRKIKAYLSWIVRNLSEIIQKNIKVEKDKESILRFVVGEIRRAVKVMKDAIKGARIELRKLRKERGKSKRHFRKELRQLRKSLRAKEKELRKLRKKKNADPSVIASLEQEIFVRGQQVKRVDKINAQLEETYSFMRLAVRQMKRLLKYIARNESDTKAYEDSLDNRERDIEKRARKLEGEVAELERTGANIFAANPHETALDVSSVIKGHYDKYSEIVQQDLRFDGIAKNIAIKNFVIAQQMAAFQQLEISLTKCEGAVDIGVAAAMQLIEAVVGEGAKVDVEQVVEALQKATKILDYEESIESFMKNLAAAIKNRSNDTVTYMQGIINGDTQLLTQIQNDERIASTYLGRVMATAIRKKVDINSSYMQHFDLFGQELERRSKNAAEAFRKEFRAQSLAPAA